MEGAGASTRTIKIDYKVPVGGWPPEKGFFETIRDYTYESIRDYAYSYFEKKQEIIPEEEKCKSCLLPKYRELDKFLENPTFHISFWGSRNITFGEKSDYLYLEDILQKGVDLLERNFKICERDDPYTKNYQFCQEERKIGLQIANKIDWIIKDLGRALNSCNYLTRFFAWVIDLYTSVTSFPEVSAYRRWYAYSPKPLSPFSFYTREQYLKVFKVEPPVEPDIKFEDQTCFNSPTPERWLAPSQRC